MILSPSCLHSFLILLFFVFSSCHSYIRVIRVPEFYNFLYADKTNPFIILLFLCAYPCPSVVLLDFCFSGLEVLNVEYPFNLKNSPKCNIKLIIL